MAMLEIHDLHVSYGAINAVRGVSFEVNQGEVVALIGSNGAGKSTILRTISGLEKAKSGSIVFQGSELTRICLLYTSSFADCPINMPSRRSL